MKFTDYVKLGFGFYVGYELAKAARDVAGDVVDVIKKRIRNGY